MLTEKELEQGREGLKEAAKPLQEYLSKYWGYYHKAIVDINHIEVCESQVYCPIEDRAIVRTKLC